MQFIFPLTTFVFGILLVYLFRKYSTLYERFKQKKVFSAWPIQSVLLDEVDKIFTPNKFGPTLETEVRFIGRGNINVPGGTSDAEAWILSVLATKSNNIFEFGTCTGKTAYLMALNSPTSARVITLTLSPEQHEAYMTETTDSKDAVSDALQESNFNSFVYSNTAVEKKIEQIFCDSKHFDEAPYALSMDLIFVDGSHAYSYVKSDSEKALAMVADGGYVIWHDYRGSINTPDVFKFMNELSERLPLRHIKETSFIVYKHSVSAAKLPV